MYTLISLLLVISLAPSALQARRDGQPAPVVERVPQGPRLEDHRFVISPDSDIVQAEADYIRYARQKLALCRRALDDPDTDVTGWPSLIRQVVQSLPIQRYEMKEVGKDSDGHPIFESTPLPPEIPQLPDYTTPDRPGVAMPGRVSPCLFDDKGELLQLKKDLNQMYIALMKRQFADIRQRLREGGDVSAALQEQDDNSWWAQDDSERFKGQDEELCLAHLVNDGEEPEEIECYINNFAGRGEPPPNGREVKRELPQDIEDAYYKVLLAKNPRYVSSHHGAFSKEQSKAALDRIVEKLQESPLLAGMLINRSRDECKLHKNYPHFAEELELLRMFKLLAQRKVLSDTVSAKIFDMSHKQHINQDRQGYYYGLLSEFPHVDEVEDENPVEVVHDPVSKTADQESPTSSTIDDGASSVIDYTPSPVGPSPLRTPLSESEGMSSAVTDQTSPHMPRFGQKPRRVPRKNVAPQPPQSQQPMHNALPAANNPVGKTSGVVQATPDYAVRNAVLALGGTAAAGSLLLYLWYRHRVGQVRKEVARHLGVSPERVSVNAAERMLRERQHRGDIGSMTTMAKDIKALRGHLSKQGLAGAGAVTSATLTAILVAYLQHRANAAA